MRPEILNPLFTEVEALKGVGPQLAKLLRKLDVTRVVDLVYHLPTGSIERVGLRVRTGTFDAYLIRPVPALTVRAPL